MEADDGRANIVEVVVGSVDGHVELELDIFAMECDGFALGALGQVLVLKDCRGVWFGGVLEGWEDFDVFLGGKGGKVSASSLLESIKSKARHTEL